MILLSAQGRGSTRRWQRNFRRWNGSCLICGRYEGVDERISEHLADREISIGDYVLSGGELGAAVIVDTVTRLIPGAVGNQNSTRQESFTESFAGQDEVTGDGPSSTCVSGGLLDYPHYTRPAEFRGMAVPEVLVNGNHDEIRSWRRKTALAKTLRNRPDLLEGIALSDGRQGIDGPDQAGARTRQHENKERKIQKKFGKKFRKENIMRNPIIEKLLAKSRRTDMPKFDPGDTIKVQVKIREGEKERLQAFEGVVIARSYGAQPSFTVRKISFGQGVERIFPIDSKVIDKIDVCAPPKSVAPSSTICAD